MIGIIDYGMGNVRSVLNAVDYVGFDAVITKDESVLNECSHLILPGVGAFGEAMESLRKHDLVQVLEKQVFEKGKPILGICLGLQLMAKSSEEHGFHEGLGWFDAQVTRFQLPDPAMKIPHMGWNDLELLQEKHPLFEELSKDNRTFYFVHSYHINCNDADNIVATCEYGTVFPAVIQKDNILAAQFHPEKSQDNGIQMLGNFLNWNP